MRVKVTAQELAGGLLASSIEEIEPWVRRIRRRRVSESDGIEAVPGIDGVTVEEFESRASEEIKRLERELS